MKKLLVTLAACVALVGCNETYYTSVSKTEAAVVDDTFYSPRMHGSGLGVGITTGGSMAVVPSSTTISEKYAVVFRCAHGKFVVENDEALWKRLQRGDRVVVSYKEVYKVVEDKDGKILSKEFDDYDFVSAKVVK